MCHRMSRCRNLYKIADLSAKSGKSIRTIYRMIDKMPVSFVNDNVKVSRQNGKVSKEYSEEFLNYIVEKSNNINDRVQQNSTKKYDKIDESIVSDKEEYICNLLAQLNEKDKQIEFLQNHISELTTMNKNFQVLLQSQQVLQLPVSKSTILNKFISKFKK